VNDRPFDAPNLLRHAAGRLHGFPDISEDLLDAADEIERLRAERDEARREVCELRTDIGFSRPLKPYLIEFAASRGWDCFKENSNE